MSSPAEHLKHSKLKIHFFYVVLILGLLVVGLITNDWTHINGFIDYLNVAAGVTSIALGVLAIIYSFVSTGSFSQSLGAIEGSASRVAKIADELGSVLHSGQSLQTRAEKRTDELHELVIQLRNGLEGLATTTTEIAGSVAETREKIGSLQKAATREGPEAEATTVPTMWDRAALDAYLKKSSLLGVIALQSVLTATSHGKFVNIEKLFGNNDDYVWGFLIASSAAGIIRIEYPENRKGVRQIRVMAPSEALSAAVPAEYQRRAENRKGFQKKVLERYKIEEALTDGLG